MPSAQQQQQQQRSSSKKQQSHQPLINSIADNDQALSVRRKNMMDGDNRPLSVLLQPGAQMMMQQQQQQPNQQQMKQAPVRTSSSSSSMPVQKTLGRQNNAEDKPQMQMMQQQRREEKPESMEEALMQFKQAKEQAQRRVKHNESASTRLINAMADLTVCLLTRAMNEGVDSQLEVRFYKKPIALAGGKYAVAEYRNGDKPVQKVVLKGKKDPKDTSTGSNGASLSEENEKEFVVLTAGELLPGEAGMDRDSVENWMKFFDVVSSLGMWWRYCMAAHKRLGWGVKFDRSFLNIIDSRVLGFVTVKISNFI